MNDQEQVQELERKASELFRKLSEVVASHEERVIRRALVDLLSSFSSRFPLTMTLLASATDGSCE
jgi:hypothetical protein